MWRWCLNPFLSLHVRQIRQTLGMIGHDMACVMLLISISLKNPITAMNTMRFSCLGIDPVTLVAGSMKNELTHI